MSEIEIHPEEGVHGRPYPIDPDVTAGDGLREVIARVVRGGDTTNRYGAESAADAVLALPALRDVLAAAARDAEKVRRVEELATELDAPIVGGAADGMRPLYGGGDVCYRIRRALDVP